MRTRALILAAAVCGSAGCAWTPRPYARDPLVRSLPGGALDIGVYPAPPRAEPAPPPPPDAGDENGA